MKNFNVPASEVQLLDSLEIEIFPEDLTTRIKASGNKWQVLNMSVDLLANVQDNWRP